MRRFISADDMAYLGADGSITGFKLFAYCENNPVQGYDPTGCWNWGEFLTGAAITVAGGIIIYESATDGVLVADISIMAPMMKAGSSVVVDFGQGETNLYSHVGIG